jgi:zinc transport system substrate-binding protein
VRFAAVARSIASALGRPAAADALVRRLTALDAEFRQGLAQCRRREIVTSHAAFAYLADRYGLEQVPLVGISPEAEPGPREVERLVRTVRETGATTVFSEKLVPPQLAETVARETGATTAVLDPLEGLTSAEVEDGADYFTIMRQNLAALRKALACR